jgi:hypothetical protein
MLEILKKILFHILCVIKIWLNCNMADCQFSYITNMPKKKPWYMILFSQISDVASLAARVPRALSSIKWRQVFRTCRNSAKNKTAYQTKRK